MAGRNIPAKTKRMRIMEKYRYDDAYGKLYEYDKSQDAYVWVANNPFNLTKQKLIEEYENYIMGDSE
jgi:hypothetical protein